MINLWTVFAVSMILAYMSEKNILTLRRRNGKTVDLAFIAMCIVMSLYCGLRTSFNDTETYIRGFNSAPTPAEYLATNPNLLENPAFYLIQSIFKYGISDNANLFLLCVAAFSVSTMVVFVRRYSKSFAFSTVMLFSLGLYISNFAAVKQCIAISIVLLAIPSLLRREYVKYIIAVLLASLFHAYALMLIILPLFLNKPWTKITYITIFAFIVVIFTFEATISNFLDLADSLGKEISDDVVFETEGINLFRLAVFSIPFLISFIFRYRIKTTTEASSDMYLFINMAILSFLVMGLGIFNAANLFGRSANYFQIGAVISLPWMIKRVFAEKSANVILGIAAICYIFFLWYGYRDFDINHISIIELLRQL